MLRRLHSLFALPAALFIVLLAVTGAGLSIDPVMERAGAVLPAAGQLSVAELAGRVTHHYPGVEQIERRPSGAIVVYYSQDGQTGADLVNPFTGQALAPYQPSAFFRWLKQLHRSLLLDTPGRAVAGVTALVMLLLSLSGGLMLARQQSGWRRLLRPLSGNGSKRLHAELSRLAMAGLLLSALTGVYMSAVTFGWVTDAMQAEPERPAIAAGKPAAVDTLTALKATDLTELRELVYPYPDDPSDLYSLRTALGAGYVDPSSGALVSYQANDSRHTIYQFIYMLHTGEGLWWLGLLLGLSALAVPVMTVTGIQVWWTRRRAMPRLAHNSRANAADTLILVGSEGNSTWGFAKTLHDALTATGQRVHTAPMNRLASRYRHARRMFILTSTYGDGAAPASGNRFLTRLARIKQPPDISFAVLGFGDRQFPQFCRFARDVEATLLAQGWPQLLPLETIDRLSEQAFSRWGSQLGKALDTELELTHAPCLAPGIRLQLAGRVDYGTEVQAPTSVLRFQLPPRSRSGLLSLLSGQPALPHFEAGDLVGIYPPGSKVPRFYSLASASRDGLLEICVRQHAGGLCSSFLHALPPGGTIDAFIRPNPAFRPLAGKAPVILIGAGTGIGPLAGFIRHNTARHPMHLYWGGRHPQSDFLYQPELQRYLADRRLTRLNTAFSRVGERSYVQDRITADGSQMRGLIEMGAQILVCGGRDMANSVMEALDQVMAPLNLDVQTLRAQGRYREDVY